jgi:hypothetical protein
VQSDSNDYITNLYIGVTPRLSHPQQYKVATPRNHGGDRQLCPIATVTAFNAKSLLPV